MNSNYSILLIVYHELFVKIVSAFDCHQGNYAYFIVLWMFIH